ncbi:MAG: hypothetical protein EOR61_33075, partial [Mesorhizobium sp.]
GARWIRSASRRRCSPGRRRRNSSSSSPTSTSEDKPRSALRCAEIQVRPSRKWWLPRIGAERT